MACTTRRTTSLVWTFTMVMVMAGLGTSATALESDTGKRIGIVSLDQSPGMAPLTRAVVETLASGEFEVLVEDSLVARLRKRQAPQPGIEVVRDFSGLGTAVAEGIEKFFYQGNDAAIESLTPLFELGMANLDLLARRPDIADQIFQAGLVLIRAHQGAGSHEEAKALTRLLVQSFPGNKPSSSLVPPQVVDLFAEQGMEVAAMNTVLALDAVAGQGCTTYINGAPVDGRSFAVVHGVTYYLTMDCATEVPPVWSVSLREGESLTVPLSGFDPLRLTMADRSPSSRGTIERHLRLIAFWGELDTVLGISRTSGVDTSDSVIIVRLERDAGATWSDSSDEQAIRRTLVKVFPELEQGEAGQQHSGLDGVVSASPETASGDWLSPTLIGGGAVLAALGGYFIYSGQTRTTQIQCSPNSTTRDSGLDCNGVEPVHFQTNEEFDAALTDASNQRIGGYSALGVGVALMGWGTWRLLSSSSGPGSGPAGGDTVHVGLSIGRDHAVGVLGLRF